MAKSKAVVWVVELWNDERERWEPMTACALTNYEAANEKRICKLNNPDDRFRVSKYVRERV